MVCGTVVCEEVVFDVHLVAVSWWKNVLRDVKMKIVCPECCVFHLHICS